MIENDLPSPAIINVPESFILFSESLGLMVTDNSMFSIVIIIRIIVMLIVQLDQ